MSAPMNSSPPSVHEISSPPGSPPEMTGPLSTESASESDDDAADHSPSNHKEIDEYDDHDLDDEALSSNTMPPSSATKAMPPPPKPTIVARDTAETPPPSGQNATRANAIVDESVQTHRKSPVDTTISASDENSGDPNDALEAFDWGDLEERYHAQIAASAANEAAILGEFDSLCQYFAVWADTTQRHEVDRSFKRLKTQTSYVQHEEAQLEERRAHYVKVVDAFRSALQLLGN